MIPFLYRFHYLIIFIILIFLILFSWIYTILGFGMEMSAWKMTLMNYKKNSMSIDATIMFGENNINIMYVIMHFFMWFLMMVAMMLPSATPVILMFDRISSQRKKLQYKYVPIINFVLSYLVIWGLFSFLATAIHLIFERYGLLNSSSLSVGHIIGGILFVMAGIYQMTPFKNSCVYYCRNPIELLSTKKIFNNLGAFYVGIKHGMFCVGCCWVLMLILFYVGVMNIFWITILSLYVLVEKYLFKDRKYDFLAGLILILWGLKILYIQ